MSQGPPTSGFSGKTPSSPAIWPLLAIGVLLISCAGGAAGLGAYGLLQLGKAVREFEVAAVPDLVADEPLHPLPAETPVPQVFVEETAGGGLLPFPELGTSEVALPPLECTPDDFVGGEVTSDRNVPFDDLAPAGGWLVGLRIGKGPDGGGAIRSLQPIYQLGQDFLVGRKCGGTGETAQHQFLARPGYAIGGIHLRKGFSIHSLAIEFQHVDGQKLNPEDRYASEWYGAPGGHEERIIGGEGFPAVGIAGSATPDVVELCLIQAMPLPTPELPLAAAAGKPVRGENTGPRTGTPFTVYAPAGGLLVGLRIFQGESWGGAVKSIQPIYQIEDRYELGPRCGQPGGQVHQVLARPGFAVSGVDVTQGLVVNSLQLRFSRIADDGRPELSDTYQGTWVGCEGGGPYQLDGKGKPVAGLSGSFGEDLQSLELVLLE